MSDISTFQATWSRIGVIRECLDREQSEEHRQKEQKKRRHDVKQKKRDEKPNTTMKTALKAIFLDLNGVLCRKKPLDPSKPTAGVVATHYQVINRPDAFQLGKTLKEKGHRVYVYTSCTQGIGLRDIIDGVIFRKGCIPIGESYRVEKSITKALEVVRMTGQISENSCLLVDDSHDKVSNIPDSQKLIVPSFDSDTPTTAISMLPLIMSKLSD